MNLTKYYSDMIYKMRNEKGKYSEAIMQIIDTELATLDLLAEAGAETKTELERMKVFVIETGKEFLGGKKGVL